MKRKIELGMTILLLLCMIFASRKLSTMVTSKPVQEEQEQSRQELLVVVDAGHGAHDPGKVGVNDALEKDINLAIAKKLQKALEKEDIQVVMTRKDDTAEDTKLKDMKKRVALINEVKPDLVVSIHQNSYADGRVRGPQVFYFTHSKESEGAASLMQAELASLDEEHVRQIKANDSFYMLKKTEVPTIIVECGFLSNAEEAEKLVSEEYQQQLADTICSGVRKWLDK
ncbi:MAG: N-acetylmuramoyl-L-alanine amidase [Faecalimonas sp.]|nr:N-acetylmuramoyl-L-alanine amidase [Faecalimonas sp.]